VPFLDYDVEIRKIICSTNVIEPLNARAARPAEQLAHEAGRRPGLDGAEDGVEKIYWGPKTCPGSCDQGGFPCVRRNVSCGWL
jgi:hypothetical protein